MYYYVQSTLAIFWCLLVLWSSKYQAPPYIHSEIDHLNLHHRIHKPHPINNAMDKKFRFNKTCNYCVLKVVFDFLLKNVN